MAILEDRNRTYLKVAGLTWLGLCLLCAAICVFADPYRLFGTPAVAGLNALKPRASQQLAMSKTVQLDRVRPRTLLLGNSRVENGFNPDSPVWPRPMQPVFNAGLPGYDLFMARRMLDEALNRGPVETIILQVDFPDFLKWPVPADYRPPLLGDEKRLHVDREGKPNGMQWAASVADVVHATLTVDAIYDSVTTLARQDVRYGVTITPAGFNPLRQYELEVRQIGYAGLFTQKLAAYRKQLRQVIRPDFTQPYRNANFLYLEGILRIAENNGIKLIIFIPPYHAEYLQLIEDQGLWPEFQAWKRALVRVVANQTGASKGRSEVELVDFSGESPILEERAPPKGAGQSMRWYWEPGHFKPALGDEVLRRLLTGKGEFGETLFQSSWLNQPGALDPSFRP